MSLGGFPWIQTYATKRSSRHESHVITRVALDGLHCYVLIGSMVLAKRTKTWADADSAADAQLQDHSDQQELLSTLKKEAKAEVTKLRSVKQVSWSICDHYPF